MGLSLRAAWRRMRPEPTPPVPRGEGRRRGSGRPSSLGRRKPPRDPRLALRARCWSRLPGPEESVPVTSGRCRSYVALGVHPWGSGDMDNVCVSPSHTARETRREEPVPTHRERSRCACSHRALWRDMAGLTCVRATLPKHEHDPESPGCWARPTGSESAGLGRQPRCAAGRDHTSRPAIPDKARPGPGGGLWGAGGEDKPGAVSTHGRRGAGGAATLGPARTLGTGPSLVHTEAAQSCVLCPQPRAGATSTRPGLGRLPVFVYTARIRLRRLPSSSQQWPCSTAPLTGGQPEAQEGGDPQCPLGQGVAAACRTPVPSLLPKPLLPDPSPCKLRNSAGSQVPGSMRQTHSAPWSGPDQPFPAPLRPPPRPHSPRAARPPRSVSMARPHGRGAARVLSGASAALKSSSLCQDLQPGT